MCTGSTLAHVNSFQSCGKIYDYKKWVRRYTSGRVGYASYFFRRVSINASLCFTHRMTPYCVFFSTFFRTSLLFFLPILNFQVKKIVLTLKRTNTHPPFLYVNFHPFHVPQQRIIIKKILDIVSRVICCLVSDALAQMMTRVPSPAFSL